MFSMNELLFEVEAVLKEYEYMIKMQVYTYMREKLWLFDSMKEKASR